MKEGAGREARPQPPPQPAGGSVTAPPRGGRGASGYRQRSTHAECAGGCVEAAPTPHASQQAGTRAEEGAGAFGTDKAGGAPMVGARRRRPAGRRGAGQCAVAPEELDPDPLGVPVRRRASWSGAGRVARRLVGGGTGLATDHPPRLQHARRHAPVGSSASHPRRSVLLTEPDPPHAPSRTAVASSPRAIEGGSP